MTISVITINYNNANGLSRTIKSVISQTCNDYEYIIIDGGSSDGSKEIIERYKDKLAYWISEPDNGVYNAMNKGVAVAKGQYCIFMNSGDCFYDKDVVKDIIEANISEDIVTGAIQRDGNFIYNSPKHVSMRHFYHKTLFHQASFIKTSVLKEIPYDESYKAVSDWKFFIEAIIVKKHTYRSIDRTIACMEPDGIGALKEISIPEHLSVLHHFLPEYVFQDYEVFINGETKYDKFYLAIKNSHLKRFIYIINCFIVKCCNIGKRKSWTKDYSVFERI